jgi:hypothetical protein
MKGAGWPFGQPLVAARGDAADPGGRSGTFAPPGPLQHDSVRALRWRKDAVHSAV